MIYLNLTIRNPWSDKFEIIAVRSVRLAKHKAWEFEIYRSDTIAELETKVSVREDHAGFMLGLGLLSYTARFQFYDTRHWNYDKKAWEIYEEDIL
jgi:hypothetical protein